MNVRRVILPVFLLLLSTLACRAVDEMLEPQATFAPPPTPGPSIGTPTTIIEEGSTEMPSAATPTLAITPTTAVTLEEVGPAPDALEPLQQWLIQAYATGTAIDNVCSVLRGAAWQQERDSCETADLDGDEEVEWLLTLDVSRLQENEGDSNLLAEGHPGDFWIVNRDGVVFMERGIEEVDFFDQAPVLFELADMTGDDRPEAITMFTSCGAHTCFNNYQVIGAPNGPIANLVQTPVEAEEEFNLYAETISLSYVDEEALRDETGDDLPDLVIRGGIIGSAGAGIQRARTEIWSWDGAAISLAEQLWEDTGIRLHTLYNANYAFEQGQMDVAAQQYEAVIVDPNLEDIEWGTGTVEEIRNYARQFAGFRLTLLPLLRGDITEAGRWRNWLQDEYANAPIAEAAALLMTEWETNGNNMAAACRSITDSLNQTDATGPLIDMGYNNPSLTAESVCPIR